LTAIVEKKPTYKTEVRLSEELMWDIARQIILDQKLYNALSKIWEHEPIIELVRQGANLNIRDEYGYTLSNSTYWTEEEVKIFLEHGANPNVYDPYNVQLD